MTNKIKNLVRPGNLYIEVISSLKKLIFSGELEPGESLPNENLLSSQMGVSRPVIREALRVLQMQGFLEIRRGSRGGTYVTDLKTISLSDNLEDLILMGKISIKDLTQVRLFMEPEVFRLAAANGTEGQIEMLGQIVSETQSTRDHHRRIELNVEFHQKIVEMANNPLYTRFMKTILDFIRNFIKAFKPSDHRIHDDQDHAAIYDAIKEKDEKKVVDLTRSHVNHVCTAMLMLEKEWLSTLSVKDAVGE